MVFKVHLGRKSDARLWAQLTDAQATVLRNADDNANQRGVAIQEIFSSQHRDIIEEFKDKKCVGINDFFMANKGDFTKARELERPHA